MKVLTTSSEPQVLKIIPSVYVTTGSLKIVDDQTLEEQVLDPTYSTDNDYQVITAVFNLTEGHYYDFYKTLDFNIWNQNNENWQINTRQWDEDQKSEDLNIDKIFCTDQTIDQQNQDYYNINEDEYVTEDTFDNDYIVI